MDKIYALPRNLLVPRFTVLSKGLPCYTFAPAPSRSKGFKQAIRRFFSSPNLDAPIFKKQRDRPDLDAKFANPCSIYQYPT